MSNETCAQTLLKLSETGVKHALLGHLSRENNTPELAMNTVREQLNAQGVRCGRDIFLNMTWRDRHSGIFAIE